MTDDVSWIGLAAGKGTRLRPITVEKPKAMVSVAGRPLVEWLLDTAREAGIRNRSLVTGYRSDVIERRVDPDVTIYRNDDFETTDMVYSLWQAADALDGTVVLSYCDVLYSPEVLTGILESPHDVAVAVDERWQPYWSRRHDDPVSDAESLDMTPDDRITSIGGAVESVESPDAQYVGLLKFSPQGVDWLRETYQAASRGERPVGRGKRLEDSHMTDLLHGIIERGLPVHGHRIDGGWVEIDTPRDLNIARSVCRDAGDGTVTIDRTEAETGS